jgi:D-alanyl-D-alanine carboxypeptidase/D-alanyl-D-alanine-endopeptidase (penicillin-binding protein 4)
LKTVRTAFVLILFSFVTQFSQNTVKKQILGFSKFPELKQASWSICAKYVSNGATIVKFQPDLNLAPASGLKVFTTSAALNILGKNYRFETKILADGKIKNGVLKGNLIIVGSGDPTLGSDKVEGSLPLDSLMMTWAEAVREAGIKKIQGSVIADAGAFDTLAVPGRWCWIDLGNYYAAQTSALTINDNLYKLFFKPNNKVGDIAEFLGTEPELDGIVFVNEMKTGKVGSGDNGYVYRSPYDSLAILRGTVPQGYEKFSIKGSLPDPPMFAANYFTRFLKKNGVPVYGKPRKIRTNGKYKGAKLIITTLSPPLYLIVKNINKISNNLYTEQLLKSIALKKYGYASEDNGIKAVKHFVAESGVDTTGLNLFDGCGLSRSNTITAEMMTDLLIANTHRNWFPEFYRSLAVAGKKDDAGYFTRFGKGTPLENNARIKGGFIGGVRSHSGYLKTRSGKLIAFSLIANNFTCKVKKINKIHEKILIMLSNLK